MPSSSDPTLLSDWPRVLVDLYGLYARHLRTKDTTELYARWRAVDDLDDLSTLVAKQLRLFSDGCERFPILPCKPNAGERKEVIARWMPWRTRYRELHGLYAGLMTGFELLRTGQTPGLMTSFYSSAGMRRYELVRKWIYETDPKTRVARSEAARVRYYARIGMPMPETKRNYTKKET
jgi:hypothetical protein